MIDQRWWNDPDRGKGELLGQKPLTVPLGPPQISHASIHLLSMCKITLYVSMDTCCSLMLFLLWLIAFVVCCVLLLLLLLLDTFISVVLFLFLGLYQIWSI